MNSGYKCKIKTLRQIQKNKYNYSTEYSNTMSTPISVNLFSSDCSGGSCPTPGPSPGPSPGPGPGPSGNKDPAIAAIEAKFSPEKLTSIFKLAELNGSTCSLKSNDVEKYKLESNVCYTWQAFSDAVYIYNKYIVKSGIYIPVPTKADPYQYMQNMKFLGAPTDISNNLRIIAAFLAQVWQESAMYKSCREILTGDPAGYAVDDCRFGYGNGWGKLQGPYCGQQGLNSVGLSTRDAAKCQSTSGPQTGGSCYFGRGSIQATYARNYLNIYNWLKNFNMSQDDIKLMGLSSKDDIDVFKYPDNICKSGAFAFLAGLIPAAAVCPNSDSMLGTNKSPVGTGCKILNNAGQSSDCSSAKPDCIGCRMGVRCVGGGGAGAAADNSSPRALAYIEFMKGLGLS